MNLSNRRAIFVGWMMKEDEYWMRQALRLAQKGKGRTSPNPMVGAVLVREGKVIGEGFHAKAGEPHAEILALSRAGHQARGATLYINLEPCSHQGRTPPCAPEVIQAGVRRVVVGMEDPNPLVKGRGLEMLREAGLDVEVGLLESDCKKLNESFIKYICTKQPFVILKIAATLDGKIATAQGESKWITGEKARKLVQRLRNESDGILVGIGTILKDDPLLTPRIKGGKNPFRIVLDSQLRIPDQARVLQKIPEKTILVTSEGAPDQKIEEFKKKGSQVLVLETVEGRINLRALLFRLGEMGITSLLVEGGSEVNGSFLREGLMDKLLLFLSPKLLGGQALEMFGGRGVEKLEDAYQIDHIKVKKVGEDLLIEGYPKK